MDIDQEWTLFTLEELLNFGQYMTLTLTAPVIVYVDNTLVAPHVMIREEY